MITQPPFPRAVRTSLVLAILCLAPAVAGEASTVGDKEEAEAATAAGEATAATDAAALEAGRAVFTTEATPSCTVCHTLADADASGAVGPNLDQLQPSLEMVRQAVTGGVGIMPAYGDSLSEEQIEAVSLYVSTVAGNAS